MILALNTAISRCSVALVHQGAVLWKRQIEGPRKSVEVVGRWLLSSWHEAENHGLPVQALAIPIGPGSFNGLRVNLAAAKAFAWAKGIPIIPVNTLEILAFEFRNKIQGRALGILHSHQNFFHYAWFEFSTGKIPEIQELSFAPMDQLPIEDTAIVLGIVGTEILAIMAQKFERPVLTGTGDAAYLGMLAEQFPERARLDLVNLKPEYNAAITPRKWSAHKPSHDQN